MHSAWTLRQRWAMNSNSSIPMMVPNFLASNFGGIARLESQFIACLHVYNKQSTQQNSALNRVGHTCQLNRASWSYWSPSFGYQQYFLKLDFFCHMAVLHWLGPTQIPRGHYSSTSKSWTSRKHFIYATQIIRLGLMNVRLFSSEVGTTKS